MAKAKKSGRDYSKYFNKPAADLPLPEEVNEKVVEVTQAKPQPKPKPKPVVQETPPPPPPSTQVIHQQPVDPEVVSKRGRKPLEEPKVPYTTALTEDHKMKLKMQAIRRNLRPSDMLHEILAAYFAELEG